MYYPFSYHRKEDHHMHIGHISISHNLYDCSEKLTYVLVLHVNHISIVMH